MEHHRFPQLGMGRGLPKKVRPKKFRVILDSNLEYWDNFAHNMKTLIICNHPTTYKIFSSVLLESRILPKSE